MHVVSSLSFSLFALFALLLVSETRTKMSSAIFFGACVAAAGFGGKRQREGGRERERTGREGKEERRADLR